MRVIFLLEAWVFKFIAILSIYLPSLFAQAGVLDLQPVRPLSTQIESGGQKISLLNVNPNLNLWFVLYNASGEHRHLENANSQNTISLSPQGLEVGSHAICSFNEIFGKALTYNAYISICNGLLLIRNPEAPVHIAKMEQAKAWAETLHMDFAATYYKQWQSQQDEKRLAAGTVDGQSGETDASGASIGLAQDGPLPAWTQGPSLRIATRKIEIPIAPSSLAPEFLSAGSWYPSTAKDLRGVYVSLVRPELINSQKVSASRLLPILSDEEQAPVYSVAFDLSQFEMGYSRGATDPGVQGAGGAPGPDGFSSLSPLVPLGQVSPRYLPNLVSTFVAGFKRPEGFARMGPLTGQYYGFMENGIVMSRIREGFATVAIKNDGQIWMGTWTSKMNQNLTEYRFIRQNVFPVISGYSGDENTGHSVASEYIGWKHTWSGDQTNSNESSWTDRQVRASLCMQQRGDKRFLIFSHFYHASIKSVAKVMAGYRCNYGMLLDMNRAGMVYLATYLHDSRTGAITDFKHLNSDTSEGDPRNGMKFVTANSNRDFFFITRKVGN